MDSHSKLWQKPDPQIIYPLGPISTHSLIVYPYNTEPGADPGFFITSNNKKRGDPGGPGASNVGPNVKKPT